MITPSMPLGPDVGVGVCAVAIEATNEINVGATQERNRKSILLRICFVEFNRAPSLCRVFVNDLDAINLFAFRRLPVEVLSPLLRRNPGRQSAADRAGRGRVESDAQSDGGLAGL